jgi:hypothetical protein
MKRSRADKPVQTIVADGEIVGLTLRDGTFVKAGEPCCENPFECRRDECWSPWQPPPKPPWWQRW